MLHPELTLRDAYSHYPEAKKKPVIGLTANYVDGDATLRHQYYDQVVAAGGVPVLIPPVDDVDTIVNTLTHVDGLVLTGGGDYNPLLYGEQPSPLLHSINARRDDPEWLLTRLAYNRQIPMLGICRGCQTLAIALGGHVAQDLSLVKPSTSDPADAPQPPLKHSQDADRTLPTHTVTIATGTRLHDIFAQSGQCVHGENIQKPIEINVNSFHHQAVDHPGSRLKISATAPDGVVEAVESNELRPIVGVQWHPEWLGTDGLPLFNWLVAEADLFRRAKDLHSRIVTLDSHCDTPMFFPQGVDFSQRDSRILVDLHKMTEGHQDVVTMAAYLPQPKAGERFRDKVDFDVETPQDYTDLIFDKIEAIAQANSHYIEMARTPADVYAHKQDGRKSIMLAIENGLAIGHSLDSLRHFATRGIVYMTLCHNGDNDICDSARGTATHGGLSAFGGEVVREMNRLGIMVDLSHGAETSFYDALDASQLPIVCSHSNCRALCDHPRNLTDDQLRALARKGGVMQVTLYHGFLRTDESQVKASINDVLAHLNHAVKVMGIDHVGLGTDFDGDGGVLGLADSSQLINFTIALLHRRYSESDIRQIWGGNWLRVMEQVQTTAERLRNNL